MTGRVKEIIESSGVDQQRLSSKAGIEVERLREILDEENATLGELRRISEALEVPLTDFVETSPLQKKADLLFRRGTNVGKSVQQLTISSLSRQVANSLDLLRAPQSFGLWWSSKFESGDDTYEGAERNAQIFRSLFCNDDQLSPLYSLPKIAISRMETMLFVIRNSEIDGASASLDGVPFIFVSARFPARMLFTLAHEIGHLVAHHSANKTYATIDENIERESSAPVSKEEQYADAFASALLMPRGGVGIALKKVRELTRQSADEIGDIEIGYLARIFAVSFWAAARRCEDLKLLPAGGAASLNERLKKDYGSAEKRAEQAGLPPRPRIEFPHVPEALMARVIARIRDGDISLGRAAASLGISIEEILSANAPTTH